MDRLIAKEKDAMGKFRDIKDDFTVCPGCDREQKDGRMPSHAMGCPVWKVLCEREQEESETAKTEIRTKRRGRPAPPLDELPSSCPPGCSR